MSRSKKTVDPSDVEVTLSGLGRVKMSDIDFDNMTTDQATEISRMAHRDPRISQALMNIKSQLGPEALMSAMQVGKALTPTTRSGTKMREKKGERVSSKKSERIEKQAMRSARMANPTTSTTCVFITHSRKIKNIPMPSTDKSFFEKILCCNGTNIRYEMINPNLFVAFTITGKKNKAIREELAKYNLPYIDDIANECVIYSMTKSITRDML